jgi:hypothetical protein
VAAVFFDWLRGCFRCCFGFFCFSFSFCFEGFISNFLWFWICFFFPPLLLFCVSVLPLCDVLNRFLSRGSGRVTKYLVHSSRRHLDWNRHGRAAEKKTKKQKKTFWVASLHWLFLWFRLFLKMRRRFFLRYCICSVRSTLAPYSRIDTPRSIPAPRSENGKRKVLKPTTGPELALRDKSEAEWHSYR